MNSIRKNTKNEIDDLFYQKLSNLDIKPNADSKTRFLNLVEKKNKKMPLWYFSTAASLILISSMGWFILSQKQNANIYTISNLIEVTPTIPQKPIIEVEIKDSDSKKIKNQLFIKEEIQTPKKATNNNEIFSSIIPYKMDIVLIEQPQVSLTGVSEIDELIEDELTIAYKASESKRNEKISESKIEKTNDFFQKSEGETFVIVSSDWNIEEDIYIPNINYDSPISLAEAADLGLAKIQDDRSLFAKVFTELRHLKHGEKVNLNALSASNDDYFVNKDESLLSHETLEFRQRINWIRDKLSKDY